MSGFARQSIEDTRRQPRLYGTVQTRLSPHVPLAFALICVTGLCAFAAPKLPAAGQVLDRYVSVTGGVAAWHANHTETDEIEGRTLDGLRVVLRATVTVSRSGSSLSEIQIPQNASEGVYKGVAWASSHFSGVRIKRGTEREEAILDARMLEEADWRELYPKSQVAGIETIGQERCYKVLLLPSPTQKTEWFSISSGLLVKRSAYELSPSGDTPAGYTVEAWAEHDGIKQPSVMLAWRGDFEYRLKVLSTEYNPKHADLAVFSGSSRIRENRSGRKSASQCRGNH